MGTQPGDAGRLGPESGRVADSNGLGDETRVMLPPRMRTTSWDLGQPNSTTNGFVYNQKRHGTFLLGNRMVTFERRFNVPRQLSPEFLLVDLVNEPGDLAEDWDAVSFSGSRKSERDGSEEAFTGSVSLRQILHAEKVSGILHHAARVGI